MNVNLEINDLVIDDISNLSDSLDKNERFQLSFYNGNDGGGKIIGVWIENKDRSKACTIMFDIKRKDALFFAKSLLAMSESL